MAQDLLNSYKYGWKTSYYQNTYDFKGEEEDLQPAGIDVEGLQPGEDVELSQVNGHSMVNGHAKTQEAEIEDGADCDACAI